jgi:hypothetical protein
LLIAPFALLIAPIRETFFDDHIISASDFLFV